jgi:hypothetical protein
MAESYPDRAARRTGFARGGRDVTPGVHTRLARTTTAGPEHRADQPATMIRQYRHATRTELWELPAGLLGTAQERAPTHQPGAEPNHRTLTPSR